MISFGFLTPTIFCAFPLLGAFGCGFPTRLPLTQRLTTQLEAGPNLGALRNTQYPQPLNGGSLGSGYDEERSEMRYVM